MRLRTLITGGAGFIGSHLADALVERGDRVVILDDLSTGRIQNIEHLLKGGKVEFVDGSVLDEGLIADLMSSADLCFHLASSVGVRLIVQRTLESVQRTVRGSEVVMGAAARHGVRLLFTSTSEIYGKNSGAALHEQSDRILGTPTISRWSYSTAKAFGEVLATSYVRERNAEMVIARLFNSVGPRQTGAYGMVLPNFVRQALSGEPVTVFGDGSQSRCFTHVRDTVGALIELGETDAAIGKAYNVGSDEEIKIFDLAERVIKRTDSSSAIRFIPFEQAYGEGFEELGRRRPDCSAIRSLLRWTPRRNIDHAIDDVAAHECAPLRDFEAAIPQPEETG